MSPSLRAPHGLALVLLTALLGGCVATDEGTGLHSPDLPLSVCARLAATGSASEARHVNAPLTDRFPALDTPASATWHSGSVGDDRVPGPPTYWIQAVVLLNEDTAGSLRVMTQSAAAATPPAVIGSLSSALPAGKWRTSDQLDAAFALDDWQVSAAIAEAEPVVVLCAIGGH